MAMSDFKPGLEGVVAFQTEIAEPDREGGALRYRGVDIEDLVGQVPFEKVWGLLVDGEFDPGLPPAEPWPLTVRSGDPRVDVQSALAMLAPEWGFRPVIDISDEECRDNLARASVMALSFVLRMLDDVEREGDARRYVVDLLDRGERLMGFGHRVYRAEDPRARVLRRTAHELGAPRAQVAEALEEAALAELRARKPDRVLATNVEFWSAVVLDYAEVPPELFTPLFSCARVAGWSAHILEQKREGRLIRPTAKYLGPPSRPLSDLRA